MHWSSDDSVQARSVPDSHPMQECRNDPIARVIATLALQCNVVPVFFRRDIQFLHFLSNRTSCPSLLRTALQARVAISDRESIILHLKTLLRMRSQPQGARQARCGWFRTHGRGSPPRHLLRQVRLGTACAAGPSHFAFSQEVENALAQGIPVVALESTIITHGMPYPQNLETAKQVEQMVRENGAVPATIAILEGVPHIGLTEKQLKGLALVGQDAVKTSRRDFAFVMAKQKNGATTVSGTMILAHKAGIDVFVTGGIGGVHRGAENSMDISADLTELGRTPMAVVCAGAKSVLDIPRTMEYLETQGVCVATYRSDEFPAFFTRSSGCASPHRVDSPQECARMIEANRVLDLQSGLLFAVPIPEEQMGDAVTVQSAIDHALVEADEQGIIGKDVTPFLLERVNTLSGGKSLASNIALILNNARIGAQIAASCATLRHTS